MSAKQLLSDNSRSGSGNRSSSRPSGYILASHTEQTHESSVFQH